MAINAFLSNLYNIPALLIGWFFGCLAYGCFERCCIGL